MGVGRGLPLDAAMTTRTSGPFDADTLRACCAVICEECETLPWDDCVRDLDGTWWHRDSELECEAWALHEKLDPSGTIFGAYVVTYQCPTCGAGYTETHPVPCCDECHPDRFA